MTSATFDHEPSMPTLVDRLEALRAVGRRFPLSLLEFGMRMAVGATFFRSGMNKFQSFDTAITLFRDEYRLPLLPPEIAAYLGTTVELCAPILLVFGEAHLRRVLAAYTNYYNELRTHRSLAPSRDRASRHGRITIDPRRPSPTNIAESNIRDTQVAQPHVDLVPDEKPAEVGADQVVCCFIQGERSSSHKKKISQSVSINIKRDD